MSRARLLSGGAVMFLVSAAVILLQLTLMRALSVTRYHHFSYLVISTALLGFGASGTFLTIFHRRVARHFDLWATRLLVLFAISIPAAYTCARLLPIDVRYLFYSANQLFYLLLYNLLIFIPFFFGAAVIALYLTHFSRRIPLLYGINLFASGLGGIGALGLMTLLSAQRLPLTVGAAACAALGVRLIASASGGPAPGEAGGGIRSWAVRCAAAAAVLMTAAALVLPLPGGIDRYKAHSHLQRLEEQGDARRLLTEYSPRMRLDIYEAPSLHHTLFASPAAGSLPPPQLAVLADGEMMGTVFKAGSLEETSIMRHTPQSLPYRLAVGAGGGGELSAPVLLLDESGGTNVWLAAQFGFRNITVVQDNETLLAALRGPLEEESGAVLSSPWVTVEEQNPRLFLEQSEGGYGLIQLVSAEGMPAAGGGLNSLHENHLLTVESIARAYALLGEGGYLSATRGIQTPPRDNIKMLALFAAALRRAGVEDPSAHILQARNYLAVTTMISKSPVDRTSAAAFRRECEGLQMDVEYYPGIGEEPAGEQRNVMEGPEGKEYSYYRHAALKILSADPAETEQFYGRWAYDVRPPRDDSPYFHNFFRWESLDRFIEAYGGSFFRRMELGYLILVITLIEVSAVGFLLILLPLRLAGLKSGGGTGDAGPSIAGESSRSNGRPGRLAVFVHFAAIGFGFMFIEMVFIQKLSRFLGDPIYSASAVITAILLFAGIASALQKRLRLPAERRIRVGAAAVVVYVIASLWLLDPVLQLLLHLHTPIRYLLSLLLLLPGAFFMGWLLPSGMERIEDDTTGLIPWAWGVNGFTSVAASPLAVLLSTSIGFSGVLILAALCYTAAAAVSFRKI